MTPSRRGILAGIFASYYSTVYKAETLDAPGVPSRKAIYADEFCAAWVGQEVRCLVC